MLPFTYYSTRRPRPLHSEPWPSGNPGLLPGSLGPSAPRGLRFLARPVKGTLRLLRRLWLMPPVAGVPKALNISPTGVFSQVYSISTTASASVMVRSNRAFISAQSVAYWHQ